MVFVPIPPQNNTIIRSDCLFLKLNFDNNGKGASENRKVFLYLSGKRLREQPTESPRSGLWGNLGGCLMGSSKSELFS